LALNSVAMPAKFWQIPQTIINTASAKATQVAEAMTVDTPAIVQAVPPRTPSIPMATPSVAEKSQTEKSAPRRIIYVTVTAYSSTPDQTDDTPFTTANGTHVYDGIIAANFLRFGTKVRLPEYFGDKEFTVTDRMHPRFSDRMDIWFPTRAAALDFGVQRLKVEIY